jgi:hypothetical protein
MRRDEVRLGEEARDEQRVFIPVVDNFTNRTGVEAVLTSAIRETLSSIRKVEVVQEATQADFKLLVTLVEYSTGHGPNPRRGDSTSAQMGGIGDKQSIAADVSVRLKISARLFERLKDNPDLYRVLWNREFEKVDTYEASDRTTDETGSSSAPHINASREMIQVKLMSYALSQQILDQISQRF